MFKDWLKKKLKQEDSQQTLTRILHNVLTEQNRIEGDSVYLPEQQLRICPKLDESKEGNGMVSAVIYFHVDCPEFEQPFFECVASLGKSLPEALEEAVKGFMLSAMCGIRHFLKREASYSLDREFDDRQQHWQVAKSCMALMGNEPNIEQDGWWETIAPGLQHRLGNHKCVFIKVYACKYANGEVIGECRINDVPSQELGRAVAAKAKKWTLEGSFHSQKQFFWLWQEEASYQPYGYTQQQIKTFVKEALKLFPDHEDKSNPDWYDQYEDNLTKVIGDRNMAVQLHLYLPEMACERAYPIQPSEQFTFVRDSDGLTMEVYKSDLTNYEWIRQAFYQELDNGNVPKGVYVTMVACSAMFGVLCQVWEKKGKDTDLSQIQMSKEIMNVPEDFDPEASGIKK